MEWRGVVMGVLMGWLVLSGEVMQSEGGVACGTVTAKIVGCYTYVSKGGAKPLSNSPCCRGVRALDGLASQLQQNRRDICTCLQNSAKVLHPLPNAVAALSGICGATHPFSLTENCATLP